jgi:hypothetical protein
MSNILFSNRHPKFMLMPLIFGIIYLLGIPTFIFLWSGQQYISGFVGLERYGLVYSVLCLIGAASNFAVLYGYRWGILSQISVWVITAVVNVTLHRNIEPYAGLALLFVVAWFYDVYRNRQSFENLLVS